MMKNAFWVKMKFFLQKKENLWAGKLKDFAN
jgi:hypothetical protein